MKTTYVIDYCNGIEEVVHTKNISEVKEIADNGASYTQQPIVIYDDTGSEICRRSWYGVGFDQSEAGVNPNKIIGFAEFGYYDIWSDEVEDM